MPSRGAWGFLSALGRGEIQLMTQLWKALSPFLLGMGMEGKNSQIFIECHFFASHQMLVAFLGHLCVHSGDSADAVVFLSHYSMTKNTQ